MARVFGRAIWGTDTRRLSAEIERLGELEAGTSVLDVPCGGGLAFRGLRPGQEVRYVAGDISPVMLERARAMAQKLGLEMIEFVDADVEALPFEDASFDLVLTYNSLHCFRDPPAALTEMARVLKPGGQLRGTSVVKGAGWRQDAFIKLNKRGGTFGWVASPERLEGWLLDAGLESVQLSQDGGLAFFAGAR